MNETLGAARSVAPDSLGAALDSLDAARDAVLAASVFAVDPHGIGGVCLRSPPQPARDAWLKLIRNLLPAGTPLRKIPFNIEDGRLLGGLDLMATLRSNRPMVERGVLANSDGGVLLVAMAERLTAHTAASLNAVLDHGEITIAREGVTQSNPARIGIIALDEGISDEEFAPRSLLDRLAFLLDFQMFDMRTEFAALHEPGAILAARELLPRVTVEAGLVDALCAAGLGLGAGSARVSLLAFRAAKIITALDGRTEVTKEDIAGAAKLVLAPRASVAPAAPQQPAAPQEPPAPEGDPPPDQQPQNDPPAEPSQDDDDSAGNPIEAKELAELVLAAAQAAIPAGLLERLRSAAAAERSSPAGGIGRVGAVRKGGVRGRPAGVRSGLPGASRLNLIQTLQAAAPWQRLRGRLAGNENRVRIQPEDFRVTRYKQRSQTLTIFAVDASGSAALNRLAETKGAVELLLADCYIRRDQVAVIAFRGRAAEMLLPPTRSLVRAKRSLAGLPGGGGTPLAAAIDASMRLALQARRRGETATLVMMSDGRANVARNGGTGREAAQADAMSAATAFRGARISALFIDISPRPHLGARELARRMDAKYIPLPFADAHSLSKIVIAAKDQAGGAGAHFI